MNGYGAVAEICSVRPEIIQEALSVSGEILKLIEESEIPISSVALKAVRLARLLNDSDYIKIFEYEVEGYPSSERGISPEVFRLAAIAKRTFKKKEEKTGVEKEYANIQSIRHIEEELEAARAQCEKFPQPDPNLTHAVGFSMMTAYYPSYAAHGRLKEFSEQLSGRKSMIHNYALRKYYELRFSSVEIDKSSRDPTKDDPQIIYKHISNRNKRWIRFCLVQIDYKLSPISPPEEFGWELLDEEAIENKVAKALEIAHLNKVDIICFPELSFSKEIADKISKTHKDIIIIGGSYYYNGYNVCPILISGDVLDPPYRKCTPSVFETDEPTGRGMKPGNIIYILQTSCGRFSVLTCSDYPEFSERICRYDKDCEGVDFIVNLCCDPNISRFQEKASSDCDIFTIDVIQVNKAPEDNKFGRSCVIGREHDGIKDLLITEKFRPVTDVRHKLCEIDKESMLIVDIDIEVKGPLASTKPDYRGRIKITRDKIFEFNGNEWLAVTTNH